MLYFTATDDVHGLEPWQSDGTAAGTKMVKEAYGVAGGDVGDFVSATAAVGGTKLHNFEPPPERPPGKILEGEASGPIEEVIGRMMGRYI